MSTTTTLTLESLQEQINDLQAQLALAQADSLAPNYITINPDGQVGAEFTGTINAYGITLPLDEGTGAISTEQVIQWLGAENSTEPAANAPGFLFANYDAGSDFASMNVGSGADDAAGTSRVLLVATDDTPTARAYLYMQQENRGATAWVEATADAQTVKIIGQDGSSSFVRARQNQAQSRFQFTVAAPGGTTGGINLQIGHALGAIPTFSFVQLLGSPSLWQSGPSDATYLYGTLQTLGYAGGNLVQYNFPAGAPLTIEVLAIS